MVKLKWAAPALVALAAAGLGLWLWIGGWQHLQLLLWPPSLAMPPLELLPEYLVVYPGPGQVISLSDPALNLAFISQDPENSGFDIPIDWQPGYVCVELQAAALLEPGSYWDTAAIVDLSTLTLDDQRATLHNRIVDGIVENSLLINGQVVASTSGPYGLCWEGTKRTGRHSVTFTFIEHSYSWWYEVTD